MYIILINFHVLFGLTGKLALKQADIPHTSDSNMFVSKRPLMLLPW